MGSEQEGLNPPLAGLGDTGSRAPTGPMDFSGLDHGDKEESGICHADQVAGMSRHVGLVAAHRDFPPMPTCGLSLQRV